MITRHKGRRNQLRMRRGKAHLPGITVGRELGHDVAHRDGIMA